MTTTEPELQRLLEDARAYGIDVPMLLDNIARTPTERVLRHQAALNAVMALRNAARTDLKDKTNGQSAGPAENT